VKIYKALTMEREVCLGSS